MLSENVTKSELSKPWGTIVKKKTIFLWNFQKITKHEEKLTLFQELREYLWFPVKTLQLFHISFAPNTFLIILGNERVSNNKTMMTAAYLFIFSYKKSECFVLKGATEHNTHAQNIYLFLARE